MRFVKPESLDKDSIILDVRGADEYAHERLALPHIVIKADKVDPDKFMAEYNPGGDKLVNILCTSALLRRLPRSLKRRVIRMSQLSSAV